MSILMLIPSLLQLYFWYYHIPDFILYLTLGIPTIYSKLVALPNPKCYIFGHRPGFDKANLAKVLRQLAFQHSRILTCYLYEKLNK